MLVIPAIDLDGGRSRLVYWPGAATGVGAPTDRPERIARRFVEAGARALHLVDFDGARAGRPVNLEAIARVAEAVAVPLQVAGGVDDPDAIRLVFAAGATRVVAGAALADDPDRLRACLAVAGEWLAVGLDARAERLAAYPWRRTAASSLVELVAELAAAGVGRFVVGHLTADRAAAVLTELRSRVEAEFVVAGGAGSIADLVRLRDAGASGIILGAPLFTGAIELEAALAATA
jgi:phosphoribosylformimino-5-aminoimidazole carboxamide ribotide isomerase